VTASGKVPSIDFSDHYETLQLSPNADAETINRVYRILAKRYHPDNAETGNRKKFEVIREAYDVLSDPEQRAAYDVTYERERETTLQIVEEASSGEGFAGDERIFNGILSLLYLARRRDAYKGGMGIVKLERSLGFSSEFLEFHVWYLREKGWIERLETGHLAITVAGIDRVIEREGLSLRRDRLLAEKNPSQSESSSNGETQQLPEGVYAFPGDEG